MSAKSTTKAGAVEPRAKLSGRYRKVEVRTWGDEKFRALSPIPPCGQGLWLFLITGPHTGPIPGLFRAGRAAMSEELGWDLEAFDEAFGEAFRQGMVKADFKARVVWVPNAIRHNKPESPNVVRSWAAEFDLIPECALKTEALEALKVSIHALGEAFAKAFDEAFTKPSAKPSAKPLAKAMPNQEQEQEQEQKKDTPPGGSSKKSGKSEKEGREKKPSILMKTWIGQLKAAQEKPFPDDDPVFAYAAKVGLSRDFLHLAWLVFRKRYTAEGVTKKYKDWRRVFRNAVQDNWLGLWWLDGSTYELTTRGKQAKLEHDADA